MTKEEISDMTRFALSDRIRSAVSCKCATMKAVLEQVSEEAKSRRFTRTDRAHRGASPRKDGARTGERNGSYSRNLITPVGKIEQLRVPRDREGTFTTEVFEGKKIASERFLLIPSGDG